MIPVFLQYEIRYVPILDFRHTYKRLIDNYLQFEDVKFDIKSYGNLDEHIILNFNNYHIDFRLDRLIVRYEGPISNVQRSSGATFFFYKILESLTTEHKNLAIKLSLLKISAIDIKSNLGNLENISFFKDSYLTDKCDTIFTAFSDVAVILDSEKDGVSYNLQFGPYKPSDVEKNELSPLKTSYLKSISDEDSHGIQATILRKEAITKSSYTSFKKALEESIDVLSKI